jgi:hypothetical protein
MYKQKIKQIARQKLEKIKAALAQETEQTKEMLGTYQRYAQGQATEPEMERANTQFKDLLKTLGLGVLAVLPLSPITIPAIVKIGKKYGIEVLPDSFKKMDKD